MWSTLRTHCLYSVWEIRSRSKQALLPGAVPTLTHPGWGAFVSTLSPRAAWSPRDPCCVCICCAHSTPQAHQTSLMKGKCNDELFHG